MRLNVRTWGDGGGTALLVHGLFSDSSSWYRLGPELAQRGYTVLAPDLRGHGESPRGRYSTTDWALDLVETFRGIAIDVAVGHSLGGTALAIADVAISPASTVYLDPAWQMDAAQDARFLQEWSTWLTWTDKSSLRETLGARWPDKDLDLRWESMSRVDPAVVPGLASGGGYDHSPEAARHPSLVLTADPSTYVPPSHAEDLRARGLIVETVSDSGHSWFREDFSAFLARVDAWIARTRTP